MKALLTAFALLSFVAATTVPVLSRRGLPCPWLRQRLLWSHPEQPYDERWQENTAGKGGACRT